MSRRLSTARLGAILRLLIGIGLLLVMLMFLRACLSPPQLPGERLPPAPASDTLPVRY